MLLIVFYFGSVIRVVHRFLLWEGICVPLFCERDPCCSSFFVLRGSSVLLIVFFGRGICVAPRFLFWEGDPCCS